MILSTLGLNSHGFIFGFLPKKASHNLNVIYTHIFISFPIPNRCRILQYFWVHPTVIKLTLELLPKKFRVFGVKILF